MCRINVLSKAESRLVPGSPLPHGLDSNAAHIPFYLEFQPNDFCSVQKQSILLLSNVNKSVISPLVEKQFPQTPSFIKALQMFFRKTQETITHAFPEKQQAKKHYKWFCFKMTKTTSVYAIPRKSAGETPTQNQMQVVTAMPHFQILFWKDVLIVMVPWHLQKKGWGKNAVANRTP